MYSTVHTLGVVPDSKLPREGTESVPRGEEGSTGKYQYEVEGVPEGAARRNSRERMLVFSYTPRLESLYILYPIFKSDVLICNSSSTSHFTKCIL